MNREQRWADQDNSTFGDPGPDDAMHPLAWRERMTQRQQVFDIVDPYATDEFDAILEATGHADWAPRTVEQMVAALDPPETEHGQQHHEVPWLPELVYDDMGWPPAVTTFTD